MYEVSRDLEMRACRLDGINNHVCFTFADDWIWLECTWQFVIPFLLPFEVIQHIIRK